MCIYIIIVCNKLCGIITMYSDFYVFNELLTYYLSNYSLLAQSGEFIINQIIDISMKCIITVNIHFVTGY